MKIQYYILMFFSVILLQRCSSTGAVEKPDNLIKESVMEKILYDATLMKTMMSYKPKNPDFENVLGKSYLYIKYEIDSLQLIESERYYAKFPRTYYRMYSNVLDRLNKTQDSITNDTKSDKTRQD
ncbi:DUF4296 domain-containing protein [Flavobacteriaceae bacterium]|jgi:hypothetical protein|nr:DUF4296 domain-containing protein [Flavobacteriaceae bacterium]